jgi:hypothetical protein
VNKATTSCSPSLRQASALSTANRGYRRSDRPRGQDWRGRRRAGGVIGALVRGGTPADYVVGYATRVLLRELGRRAQFLDDQLDRLDELIAPLAAARAIHIMEYRRIAVRPELSNSSGRWFGSALAADGASLAAWRHWKLQFFRYA